MRRNSRPGTVGLSICLAHVTSLVIELAMDIVSSTGDRVVYDIDNNGTADVTPGKNDQFYSLSGDGADRNLSTSPTSLVSGSLLGQPLKTDTRLKYIDGSASAYFDTTNGSWDAGDQNSGETVVFDANNNDVVDISDTVVSGGVRTPSFAEIGKPLVTQTFGGIPNKRMLNPPCTITNTAGQVVGVFVEIHGVYPENWEYNTEDCVTAFNGINGGRNYNGTICDSTGDMQTFGFQGYCGSGTYTGCNHRIHFEIDQDWMAKGWCGPSISYCNNSTLPQYVPSGILPGSTSIDVQGFIYWDPTEVTTQGHMYSGWELHPFTAWRLSASLATNIKDSADNHVTSIIAGTTVHGTAIISYGSGAFTGTVTYNFFTGSTCGGTATIVGSPVPVTNGMVPNSASQAFNAAGSFSWNAVYSGDSNNDGSRSNCEPLKVNPTSDVIVTTMLSANTITFGGSVDDSATLTGVTTNAGGTVTYNIFPGSTCAGAATPVGPPVPVSNGAVPKSGSQTFSSAGLFSWNAVYSGDANNNGAPSVCEPLMVTPPITVNFAFSPTNQGSGKNIAFTGIAAGGTLPYQSWSWNFGDNSPATFRATVAHPYSNAGPYMVRLTVVCSSGISVTSTMTILVVENRTIFGLAPILFYEIMLGLGAAVAVNAIGLYWRRTRARLDRIA